MDERYSQFAREWIDKNKNDVLNKWMEICKIPSIKGEPDDNAPFGRECAKALKSCTDMFEEYGCEAQIYDENGYSLIRYGNGEKTIGLFCHSDVVPVGDDWIYTKPFEPLIRDGALIGRGAEDNKSGIMASFCIMNILREYNIPLKSTLQLFIGSNEETGMEDIEAFVKEQPMPDVSFVPDAYFPCGTGEKGICHLYAKSGRRLENIVDFCGGEAFNIVLDKVKVVLKKSECLAKELEEKTKDNDNISVRADENTITIWAKGIAKHASLPEGSVNAAYVVAGLLADTQSLCENDRKVMEDVKYILSCPFGSSMGIEYCDELFGRLTFVNGMASMEEGYIKLSFDMRYSSALDAKDLASRTRNAFENLGWSIYIKENKPGFSIDENSRLPELFEEIYKAVTGEEKKSFKLGGGTYARHLKNAFSVGVSTKGISFEMPQGHGEAHQCDEAIDIDGFFKAVEILLHYVLAADLEIN